jgi:putative ABC transport system substrate-binding protein
MRNPLFFNDVVGCAWPRAARAQQAERVRRVGVLSSGFAADDPLLTSSIAVFRHGMQERGWSEDHNLQIDYRSAGPDVEQIESYAVPLTLLATADEVIE